MATWCQTIHCPHRGKTIAGATATVANDLALGSKANSPHVRLMPSDFGRQRTTSSAETPHVQNGHTTRLILPRSVSNNTSGGKRVGSDVVDTEETNHDVRDLTIQTVKRRRMSCAPMRPTARMHLQVASTINVSSLQMELGWL